MKRNVIVKILLDIAMLVLYLLLMFAPGLGGFFHEAAGLGIGILFLAHVILRQHRTKTGLRPLHVICLHFSRHSAQLSLVNR